MITPHLEKLILCGKASYNTYVIGGAEKCILNVANDRFIIITDLTYFSQLNLDEGVSNINMSEANLQILVNNLNTQLKIFSRKSNNTFLFRNQIEIATNLTSTAHDVFPIGSVKLDTFLIHDQDVSFTFSKNGSNAALTTAISPSGSIGNPPPFDYGTQGQTGAIPVRIISGDLVFQNVPAGNKELDKSAPQSLELMFAVNAATQLTNLKHSTSYPILNIGYIEILGSPTNIGATL